MKVNLASEKINQLETQQQVSLKNYTMQSIIHNFRWQFFVDYKKASDTIYRYIFQNKLYRYGTRGNVLNLLKSFISDRKYQVGLNSRLLSAYTINIGLLQASVFSPILFFTYKNDVFKLQEDMSTIIFADETTLLFRNKTFEDLLISTNN